jgi:hypothetical protein
VKANPTLSPMMDQLVQAFVELSNTAGRIDLLALNYPDKTYSPQEVEEHFLRPLRKLRGELPNVIAIELTLGRDVSLLRKAFGPLLVDSPPFHDDSAGNGSWGSKLVLAAELISECYWSAGTCNN